jgi:hypothetical protein
VEYNARRHALYADGRAARAVAKDGTMLGRSLLRRVRRSPIGERIAVSRYSPHNWRESLRLSRALWFDYGHLDSVITRASIDAAGRPVPWYTYPAIQYLRQLDFSAASVFEYGCGNSTLFWAGAAREVVSVEDNRAWFDQMSKRVASNCRLIFEPDLTAFVDTIRQFPNPFDVIIVDGPARGSTRLKCSRAAIECLATGGLIILDNSDWLPESARVLRDAGLLEVDMTGFAPISGYTQTTSLFLQRSFTVRPLSVRHPALGPGSRDQNWEVRPTAPGPVIDWDGESFGGVSLDEEFTVSAPGGPRVFRVLVYQSFAGPTLAILDVPAGRVLLSWYVPEGRSPKDLRAAMAEAGRIRQMSWEDLQQFVNGNRKRHYLL